MMRNILLAALCLAPFLLFSQTVDSVAIRQVDSLIQVARTQGSKQEFDQALATLGVAEAIALEKIGRESKSYGLCCFIHGWVHSVRREYKEALQWLYEAKAIQEKVIGKNHYDYGKTLYNIVVACVNTYQYERGLPLGLEARAIFEITAGKSDLNYVRTINTIAICYAQMGRFEDAEPLFLEGHSIAEAKGKDTEEYANLTGNLSHFYRLIGNYQKSMQFSLEAIELKRKLYGEGTPDYAFGLRNLANAYTKLGAFKKAEELYLQVLTIYEKNDGKESQEYAETLQFLATMYSNMLDHKKSVPLFLEVLAIKEKILGKENWGYSIAANNAAVEYIETGEWEKAGLLLLESVELDKKMGRDGSPAFAQTLNNLALVYKYLNQPDKAEALSIEISNRLQAAMSKSLHHLSEKEIQEYLKKYGYFQDCMLSLAQTTHHHKLYGSDLTATCYDNALYFKGFLLNTAIRARNAAATGQINTEYLNLLKSIERRLGEAYATPLAERDSVEVTHLEAQANELEKKLARNIVGYAESTRNIKWQEIQKRLKAGDAAVEFVRFDFYEKSAIHSDDSVYYAALLIRPGNDQPRFIPLFEEKQLATLLKTEDKPQPAFYNDLYAAGKTGDRLYDLIWKPVVAALPESATVSASPSGLLHRINLGAISAPDGKTLAEKHRLSTLGSTRQLAVPPPSTVNQNATAQLYGGIQYDVTPVLAANTGTRPDNLAARRGSDPLPASPNWVVENDSTLRGDTWNYLRWTDVEVSAAAEIMKGKGIAATVKKGAEATEESFKSISESGASPRILHIATHGFFFPDPKESKPGSEQAIGEKIFKVSENPMIRSGLVLAGGNHAWSRGLGSKPLHPGQEDGILTAYEISQMNLSNTELVVLSACETGLGDLVGNEGVYGLQRAFKIAGVRYLMMSLWQVPDFQTQVFMSAFYKHWLDGKLPVPEAFRATQSELRTKYGEAFKWAGFVLVE